MSYDRVRHLHGCHIIICAGGKCRYEPRWKVEESGQMYMEWKADGLET